MKDVPMRAEPIFSFDSMQSWWDNFLSIKDSISLEGEDSLVYNELEQINFSEEKRWMQSSFEKIRTRNVFSHSDLQRGNIMILGQPDINNNVEERNSDITLEDILLIDYEYSGLNVRWGDIAYYFCDISSCSYDPVSDSVTFPSIDESNMTKLINTYIEEWKSLNPEEVDLAIDNTQHILLEVLFGRLIVHIMVVLFFLAFVRKNHDKLHCWKYAWHRMRCYFKLKADFLSKYPEFSK